MFFFWFFLVSLILSLLVLPYFFFFLKKAKCYKENYRGVKVVDCGGLLIPFVTLLALGLFILLDSSKGIIPLSFFNLLNPLMILIITLTFLGFIDDIWGKSKVKGLRGHFKALQRGELTTGALKAIGTVALSLFILQPFSANLFLLLVNALILAFFVNFFNLLDLRPGRAVKVFVLLGTVIFVTAWFYKGLDFYNYNYETSIWMIWGLFLGTIMVLFNLELKEELMLGDAGSNVLGGLMGFTFLLTFDELYVKILALIILLAVHFLTEKYSITEVISRFKWMDTIDKWGRKGID